MSKFLYRIGRTAYSRPWYFIAGWLIALGIVVALLATNGVSVTSEMRIEGTDSQRVLDQLTKELPEASGGQGSVIFVAPEGESLGTPERTAAIRAAVEGVYALDHVINPADFAPAAGSGPAPAESGGAAEQPAATEAPPYGPLVVDGAHGARSACLRGRQRGSVPVPVHRADTSLCPAASRTPSLPRPPPPRTAPGS